MCGQPPQPASILNFGHARASQEAWVILFVRKGNPAPNSGSLKIAGALLRHLFVRPRDEFLACPNAARKS